MRRELLWAPLFALAVFGYGLSIVTPDGGWLRLLGLPLIVLLLEYIHNRPAILFCFLGVASNLSVLVLNDWRMPVDPAAYGGPLDGSHAWLSESSRLALLADRLPGGFSIGDALIVVGLGFGIFAHLAPRPEQRLVKPKVGGSTPPVGSP